MTFQRYPDTMACVLLDKPNETLVLGQLNPPDNASIEYIDLFVYKQGIHPISSMKLSITTGSKTFETDSILLSEVTKGGDNYLGRVRFTWPTKPILTASTAYDLSLILSDYTPVLTGVYENDEYFSVIRDWPTTMGYQDTIGSRKSMPIAMHVIESV